MKHKQLVISLTLAAAIVPLTGAEAAIRLPWKKKAPVEEVKDTVKKESKYEKLFKKESAREDGLITLHLSEGKVYMEFPKSLLGREFLMGTTIRSTSDNGAGVVGSKNMELKHLTFTETDSTVYLRSLDAYVMAADANIGKALTISNTGAIIRSFKIETLNPDSTAYVFNATDFFLDDDKSMSPFLEIGSYKSYKVDESYKKDLSFIKEVKSFADNISVTTSRTYLYSLSSAEGKSLVKKEPLTAEMTSSFILLSEQPYHPRTADPRIGLFFTEREQFSSLTSTSKKVFYVNRWRLEPSDTAAYRRGEKVEPVKPITLYIDNNFPEWWKPYIREAVESWCLPFENIGFKNAVVAKDFPSKEEDPEFDPDNIKYSCVRYAPIGVRNAMGPSWVDPRSGEIINASVYVYHDVIKLLASWMYVQTAQADESIRGLETNREKLGDALRYVIRHEVGHCFGLMHNMGSSACIPVESLRDPKFTQENGTTYSIMDYARFNYIAQPGDAQRGVRLTPPVFGKYDYYAIRWAYTPVFDAADFEEETAITTKWISDSLKVAPWYRYGKQQLYTTYYDPRNQAEDLGDDVIAASKYGVANLKYIMSNFMDWIGPEDEEYEFRTEILTALVNQYMRYVQHVLLNVGGIYRDEVREGDPYKAFRNVPSDKQKACLDYVFTLMEDTAWMDAPEVIKVLPVVGLPSKAVKNSILDLILLTPYFCSSTDGIDSKEFSSSECLDFIFDRFFKPTREGKKLTADQRACQRAFVNNLMKGGSFATPGKQSLAALESLRSPFYGHDREEESGMLGEIRYSRVSGFEWLPRNIFNKGDLTQAAIYAQLTKARDLMKSRIGGAAAEDKAHYEILISTIEYSLK